MIGKAPFRLKLRRLKCDADGSRRDSGFIELYREARGYHRLFLDSQIGLHPCPSPCSSSSPFKATTTPPNCVLNPSFPTAIALCNSRSSSRSLSLATRRAKSCFCLSLATRASRSASACLRRSRSSRCFISSSRCCSSSGVRPTEPSPALSGAAGSVEMYAATKSSRFLGGREM